MFHKKKEKQQKPKKLRVYTANSRKPAVIAMWLLFVCGFAFAVYKNFTAIDTHTVHEKEIVERRVEDTSGVEAFVRNFAKTYYSWSNNKDSVAQRTDALTGYLTEDLQRLTADTVKSDVAVSSSVQDVQIWSVEQNDENDFTVVFTVAQTISDGKKKDTVSSVYKTAVHKDDNGDMVITQAPTIVGKPAKSTYTPKAGRTRWNGFCGGKRRYCGFSDHLFHAVSDGYGKRAVLLCQWWFYAVGKVRGLCVQPAEKHGAEQGR